MSSFETERIILRWHIDSLMTRKCMNVWTIFLFFFVYLLSLVLCNLLFSIAFRLSQLTATTGGEFKLMSIYLFFLFLIKSSCCKFLELSSTTTIMVLKPVSCNNVTSFNYDGKKARDVGLTCWCHLSNIMPDSIFHESMSYGITCLFFQGDTCFPQDERDQISFITITSVGMGIS